MIFLMPPLILGRMAGFIAVGFYGLADSAIRWFDKLFLGVLSPVIMPAIAAQTRAGTDLKRLYLQAVELLAGAQWPFLTFVALTTEPIVRIWLGAGWLDVVPLIRLLCLASLFMCAAPLTYPILVAIGRVRGMLTCSLTSLPPSLLAIYVASHFRIEAIAASTLLVFPFRAAVAILYIGRQLSCDCIDLLRAIFKSGVVTVCSCPGVMICIAVNHFSLSLSGLGFCAAGVAGSLGWRTGLTITRHPLISRLRTAAYEISVIFAAPIIFSVKRPTLT